MFPTIEMYPFAKIEIHSITGGAGIEVISQKSDCGYFMTESLDISFFHSSALQKGLQTTGSAEGIRGAKKSVAILQGQQYTHTCEILRCGEALHQDVINSKR